MKWTVLGAAAVFAAGVTFAPVAAADPAAPADPGGPPPCPSGLLASVCEMLPMMPELDHDIDMSKQQPNAPTVDMEHLPPADVCTVACI